MSETHVSIPLAGVDLLSFLGPRDRHLRQLEDAFDGRMVIRGDSLHLSGDGANAEVGVNVLFEVPDVVRHRQQ